MAGGNSNTDGAWAEGVQPTAADDIVATAGSGNLTIPAAVTLACRSIDLTSYVGTLTFAATTSVLNVGDASGGALKFVSGMTLTLTGIGTINFVSTSNNGGAGWNVDSGGKTLPNLTFNGSGGKWVATSAWTTGATTVTLTLGTLDTAGFTMSWGLFSGSGTNVRTLTLGASAITITGTGTAWNFGTVTNLTFNANTSTITFSGAGVTHSVGASMAYNSVVYSGSGTVLLGSSTGATFVNLTRTGTAAKTDIIQFSHSGSMVISGTLTLNGNSATNRLLVQSNTVGTARTITAATLVCTNVVDFMDITGAGAATWTTGASGATAFGDAGGNSGITFTTPATQTHTASAEGNWSDVTKWTSRVPLPQDDVVVDVNTTGTLTADMPRLGKSITLTGFAGTLAINSIAMTYYGSWTNGSAMTLTGSSSFMLTCAARTSVTVTTAGKTFTGGLTLNGPGGTLTLADAFLSEVNGPFVVTNGTFQTADFTMTIGRFSLPAGVGNVVLGSSTLNLFGTGTVTLWNKVGTGTVNAGTSTIAYTSTDSSAKTFAGAGATYHTFSYTTVGTGSLTVTGNNTFDTLNISGAARTVIWPASGINHVVNWNVNGAVANLITLNSSTSGTKSDISRAIKDAQGNIFVFTGFANSIIHNTNNVSTPGLTGERIEAVRTPFTWYGAEDFEVIVGMALADYTPSAENRFVVQWGSAPNRAWLISASTNGTVAFGYSPTGSDQIFKTISDVGLLATLADNTFIWTRMFVDADNGAGGWAVTFQYSLQPSTTAIDDIVWIAGGPTVNTAGALVIAPSVYPALQLSSSVFAPTAGKFYAARVTKAGVVVASPDFRDGYKNIQSNYLSLRDSRATGRGWWAAANSTNVSGNVGWFFGYAMWLGGRVGPSGLVTKSTSRRLTGTVTPTGIQRASPLRTLSGSVSPAGNTLKSVSRAFQGTIASSGDIDREILKTLSGFISPSSTLVREITKTLGGQINPESTVNRSVSRSLAGSISPSSVLSREVHKILEGEIDSSGSLGRSIFRSFGGSVSSSGNVIRSVLKSLVGEIDSEGSVSRTVQSSLAGQISPSGNVLKIVLHPLEGSLSPSGQIANRNITKTLQGSIDSSGIIIRSVNKEFSGQIVPIGSVARNVNRFFSGSIALQGSVGKVAFRNLEGFVDPSGQLIRSPSLLLEGIITPSGLITREVSRRFSGVIEIEGRLLNFGKPLQILVGPLYAIVLDNNLISSVIVNGNPAVAQIIGSGPSIALVRHIIEAIAFE